jgi:uroporphyrin-III C-methyltransferase/precorrin-2 dehydrogenase/sirohydrochlorin ferrochelatase
MPTRTIAEFAQTAIAHGLDPATPAVAVARATRNDEAVVEGPIADLPARIERATLGGPLVVMIGRAFAESRAESADVSGSSRKSKSTG